MKKILKLSFLFLTVISVNAQDFTGTVIDQKTQEPLPFVEVYIPELNTGTVTDSLGVFHINHFSQKKIHLQISSLGYKTVEKYFDSKTDQGIVISLEQTHLDLEEVVVSKATGRLQSENTISVAHKDIEEISIAAPLTLVETITNIPGVEVKSTGVGIGKPVIRGLSGNRIVTYNQGIRVENQQWGDEHSLGVGAVGIEGVEVIKGPASLLYGSDAIGGVLYFIDERYAKHDYSEGFAKTLFNSATMGTTNAVGYKTHKNHLKFNLFGAYNSHADYKTPNRGNVENTSFDEKNLKTAFGFNTKNWVSNVRYSYLQNKFGVAEHAHYHNVFERNPKKPYLQSENHALAFENIVYAGASKFDVKLGYTFHILQEFEEHDHDHDNEAVTQEEHAGPNMGLELGTFTYNAKWYSKKYDDFFDIVLGTQGMLQNNKNTAEEILTPNADTKDIGVFAMAAMDFDRLKIQLGVRGDTRSLQTQEHESNGHEEHDVDPNHNHEHPAFEALDKNYGGFSFSAGAVYNLEKYTFRFNAASGFRAPTASELLSNGSHGGTGRYEIGNPNLKSEYATQFDFSVAYKNEHFQFEINPFFNSIQNYIYINPTGEEIEHNPAYVYTQKNAFLYGGELGLHYHPHQVHWLHLEADFSSVFAEDYDGNALPLIPQNKINTMARATFNSEKNFRLKSAFVQYIHRFAQNRVVTAIETVSPAYGLTNVGLNFEAFSAKKPLEINLGVNNLFNVSYIDHLSRYKQKGIPNIGLNAYIGLKYNFGYKI